MSDRTKRIPVAVNDNDIERIRMDAEEAGQPLSDYVRGKLGLPPVRRGPQPTAVRRHRSKGK